METLDLGMGDLAFYEQLTDGGENKGIFAGG